MISIRNAALFISMLAVAACSDDTGFTPTSDDAGGTEDGATKDDAMGGDGGISPESSDDARGADAPTTTVDGSPRRDGATDTRDAPGTSDVPNRTDAGSDATTRVDVATEAGGGNNDGSGGRMPDVAPPEGGTMGCIGAVDQDYLRDKLSKLSGDQPVNVGGTDVSIIERYTAANKMRARQFLTEEYEALGFTVTEQAYATGTNLIATKPGADGKFLVLSAHYDTVRETVPGADDDGSGVIGTLATAKALQGCQLDHGLRILAFDQEESGALGSKAYVNQLQSNGEMDNLIGDVQFEMGAYHTKDDGGFLLVDCKSSEGDRPESKFLNDAVLAAIMRGNLALQPHDACISSSDHGTFWTAGKPAIVFSEEFSFSGANANPCYHKECDTVSYVNFEYFAKMTTMSVLVTADLVGAR